MAKATPTLYNGLARGVSWLEHPNLHPEIQHPNALHAEMPTLKLENGWGAETHPLFSAPGGLHRAVKK